MNRLIFFVLGFSLLTSNVGWPSGDDGSGRPVNKDVAQEVSGTVNQLVQSWTTIADVKRMAGIDGAQNKELLKYKKEQAQILQKLRKTVKAIQKKDPALTSLSLSKNSRTLYDQTDGFKHEPPCPGMGCPAGSIGTPAE